ncbi:hypothetical protein CYLTODRAFT_173217 [Cylindrobasidium torrendii FP15055 ss-10]|uniref:DUF6535 domain-containing protein n=1 Tax=Cylindrobasidium torrendii FP15055 ss-10 TaxID=1314674 RepID=A0A0D7AWE9_9AGAR|nr:hypothetical protein CYLTODRAFT_173217 [Cylindrobasidium torrendii FP15055 ss-10]
MSDIAPTNVTSAVARTDVWVNALWFTSLALSLSSALLAVLSKQWLRQYLSFVSGIYSSRACTHPPISLRRNGEMGRTHHHRTTAHANSPCSRPLPRWTRCLSRTAAA